MPDEHWLTHATEQGYAGIKVDPTPNENYTVAGVGAGLPTPETEPDTDPDQFHDVFGNPIGPTAGGGGTPAPEPEA